MRSESGQMTLDYLAGIGIFLLAVFFVFQFVYGLFIPFQSGSDEASLAADRTSTILVEQMLHADTSGGLNVIDEGKLYYFNSIQLNYSDKTNYTNTLRALGLFSKQIVFDLNVSVVNITSNSLMKQSGPPLPDNTNIGQTKRLVLIVNSTNGNQTYATLAVRVW